MACATSPTTCTRSSRHPTSAAPTARVHLVGCSLGGGGALQYEIDHPEAVRSLVLVDPVSPYGFGGTRDITGTPCWPDHAGSGDGTANPEYVHRLAQGDRSNQSDPHPSR